MLSKYKHFLTNTYLFILIMFMLFGRTFSGINLIGFRVGEIIVALCLVIATLFMPLKVFEGVLSKFVIDKKIFYMSKVFIVSFLFTVIYTNGSLLSQYTYRSSSIVWTLNIIFVSYFVFNTISEESLFFKVALTIPIILYILSTVHFPVFIIDFFTSYSDRFDFVKGSDLLIVFVSVMLLSRNYFKDSTYGFLYFLFISALYVPLFIYKSKGAFFPGLLFIVANSIYYRRYIFRNKLKSIIIISISIPIFLLSTFNSYGNLTFKKMGMDQFSQNESIVDAVPGALNVILSEKNTPEIFASFFILDGRLYSQEMMANWRLQIWQDIGRDLIWNSNYYQDEATYGLVREQGEPRNDMTFLFGLGYNEILPAMNHWERQGTDGSNENPHNFIIYALGRGGLLLVTLVISFHILCLFLWKKKFNNYSILLYMLPVFFAASFDAAFESVRYPLIYYSFYAYFYKNNIEKLNN